MRQLITRCASCLALAVLVAALGACGPSKPSGSDYLGNWSFTKACWTGSPSNCGLNISKNGESFIIKTVVDECAQNCQAFQGIFTLTPEGNLKGGPMGMIVLTFDRTKSQIMASSGGDLEYWTKTQ